MTQSQTDPAPADGESPSALIDEDAFKALVRGAVALNLSVKARP